MKKKIITCIVIISILFLVMYFFYKIYEKKQIDNSNNIDFITKNVSIVNNSVYGNNVYNINYNEKINVFNVLYQDVISEKINKLLDDNYSIENPLIIYNPYGTNNLSVNVYFNTEREMEISYTISVKNDQIKDFKNILNNDSDDNYTKEHSYQIIGLVPGYENTITLDATDKEGNKVEFEFVVDMSNVNIYSDTILESVAGKSTKKLTDGLFVLLGFDSTYNNNIYLYDNDGVVRAELPITNSYRCDRMILNDGKMYYNISSGAIAVVNRLGKIEKTYELGDYSMHHDFMLDKANNKLLILVNSAKEFISPSTAEDLIISLDLETGQIEEVVDMKDLLPEIYETAKLPEGGYKPYGESVLDWIHLNSLSIVNDEGDIVVSGREISTIIYLEDIYNKPKIKYMIADPYIYENTIYEDLLLEKKGDFINQAGQHTITYNKDDSLGDGKYYLEMYNNNYGSVPTRQDFPWDKYENIGTYTEGTSSKYYKYLIDEEKGSYELVKEFDITYSSIGSSIQNVENNYVSVSSMAECYEEYDKNGNLIKKYNFTAKEWMYRVFKYDFVDIWFNK